MELNLRNKVAFVTGASSGIGAAAAICFAQEGAHVVIGYGKMNPRLNAFLSR
jgi:NAD(P)-dependent dehydrogenase (short-subunit alcohol dehydrogenase family)